MIHAAVMSPQRRSSIKYSARKAVFLMIPLVVAAGAAYTADPKTGSMVCAGIYAETSAGSVSYRVPGKDKWGVVKVDDVVPANVKIRVNIDRDWIDFTAAGRPNEVYEIRGSEKGEALRKVADLLKTKPRTVVFLKGSASQPAPKFKDKLVVTKYLGRQVYISGDGSRADIKYGDVLDIAEKVRIIAINNTLTLMNAASASTTVIGPLNFTVEQLLTNKSLYKFLNVQK